MPDPSTFKPKATNNKKLQIISPVDCVKAGAESIDSPYLFSPIGKSPVDHQPGMVRASDVLQVAIDDNPPLLLGYTESCNHQGFIDLERTPTGLRLTARAMTEGITLNSRHTFTTEPLTIISHGSAKSQFQEYAGQILKTNDLSAIPKDRQHSGVSYNLCLQKPASKTLSLSLRFLPA